MLEDGADSLWPLREPAHVADDRPLELLLAAGRCLAGDRLLRVGVHALVRIELGAVGGQVDDLDLGPVLGQPVPGRAGPVDLQPVQDQEDLTWGASPSSGQSSAHRKSARVSVQTASRVEPVPVLGLRSQDNLTFGRHA